MTRGGAGRGGKRRRRPVGCVTKERGRKRARVVSSSGGAVVTECPTETRTETDSDNDMIIDPLG